MVTNAGVIPVVVFDGGRLPMKLHVEQTRTKGRHQHRAEADALWKEGKQELAIRKYAEGIAITGQMAYEFIKVLKQKKIQYVVAPYEADAEMAYLYREGIVSTILTEDSDLLAFGCDRVLFKLDHEGYGYEIDLHNLGKATELNFAYFSKDMFVKMCILNGCDYLPSIKGVGIKKAHKLVKQSSDIREIIRLLERERKYVVPTNYEHDFEKAFLTFKFQTVYDLSNNRLTSLHPRENTPYVEINNYQDQSFLGP